MWWMVGGEVEEGVSGGGAVWTEVWWCEGGWDFCTVVRGGWLEQEVFCAKGIRVQVILFSLDFVLEIGIFRENGIIRPRDNLGFYM